MKFGTRVRLKPSNDRGEFELGRAKNKNNIAENSFALGHETHNSYTCVQILTLAIASLPLTHSVLRLFYW